MLGLDFKRRRTGAPGSPLGDGAVSPDGNIDACLTKPRAASASGFVWDM
jgi:hypothetical protein